MGGRERTIDRRPGLPSSDLTGGTTPMTDPGTPGGTTITVRDNGNLRVEGPLTLLDGEGNPFELEAGRSVFLCRCGGSATKPFCDGSHRSNGFTSAVRAPKAEG
jgi:CDGSH-type Zn-finger protein